MTRTYTLIAAAFASVTMFSCASNNNGNVSLGKINGVHDIVVSTEYGDSMELEIKGSETADENITVSVKGLPSGVYANISPASGVPTFMSFIRFTNMSAVPGTYDCQLVCSGTESGEKTYNFTTTVRGAAVCGLLTGYNGTSNCNTNFTDNISAVIPPVETAINDIRFQNFGGRGFPVTAKANCNNHTILVPYQSINSTTSISGEGTFTTTGTLQVNYTITINGTPTNCWFALNRFNL